MRIGNKLILGFITVAILTGLVGYISVNMSQRALQKEIGEHTVMLARETLDKIDRELYHKIEALIAYSNGSLLHELLTKSNQEFEKLSNIDAYIKQKDRAWVSAPKGTLIPFMEELINNDLAIELKETIGFYKGEYGTRVFPEVYVANKYGVVIATTGRTSDYFQADELWYQKAVAEKTFWVGNIEYDESSDTYASDIVVILYDDEGNFLGILKAVLDIQEVISIMKQIEAAVEYDNTEFKLITKNGKTVYSTEGFELFEDVPKELLSRFKQEGENTEYFIAKGDKPGEGQELFAHAHSKGHGDYKGLGWILIVEHETEEIFAPIAQLRNRILINSMMTTMLAVLLGLFISKSISRPIAKLSTVTGEIGLGNLDANIEVNSNDEIGELAASFKRMARDLSQTTTSIDNLNREVTERVKAEEQIRKQNEFLNNVLESLTHPFYVIDANDYTIKIANSVLYPGKLSEKTTCYTLTHKRDKPCNGSDDPCPLEEIKKTKRPVVIEHVHYDKDGNPRNVEVHAYPILDDEGNVSEIIEYSLDITKRKQAEEKLKQTAEEWITTFDSITDLVSIHDKDFKIVRANKSFANAFNLKPSEIIGKTCYKLIHGTKEPPPFCPHKCTLDNGKPNRAEFFDPHLGIHVEASTSPIFDENGQVIATVHIAKDITERKQVECEIRDIAKFPSENPNPVLRVQKDGKILYGNDAALPLLAKWKTKVGRAIPPKWRRLIDKAFESKKAINKEDRVDGKIFSFVVAPILDGGYANLYARDITERKQVESELKAAQEKLIDTAHRAGMAEVAADVLHNVGNILNSINVSTTVIREKITSSEVANLEKVASIINEHTDDLGTFLTEHPQGKHIPVYLTEVSKCLQNEQTDIISRLLALVDNVQHIKDIIGMQQSYAKVSGAEVQTSLSKLAEDAIQINSAGLERHGTRIICEFEELGDVEIDKQKLLQILVNLVSNAKYALSDSKREEKLLTIRIYKHSEERFRIEVADNGIGISEDSLTKIFSHGFTTKEHGHGFGLHSSALTAKEMGGSLTVYSDGLGQGATFTLGLPFKPVEVMK